MSQVQDLYDARVRPMAPAERLRLARLILDDLTRSESEIDISDNWGEGDIADAAAFSAQHGDGVNPDAGGSRESR